MTSDCFHLVNLKSQTSLDLSFGSSKNGTKVLGYRYMKKNNNQIWKMKEILNSEYFFIINVASQTCLDLSGGSERNGTRVIGFYHRENNENQMWKMIQEPSEEGYFYLMNKRSGTVLDLFGGSRRNGTAVSGWKLRRGNKNQLWKKVDVELEETLEKMKKEKEELEKVKDGMESESLCVICLEKKKNVVFLPCKHLCCCEECSKKVETCPLDRGQIEEKVVVFQ